MAVYLGLGPVLGQETASWLCVAAAPMTAATQNIEECLKSETARLMLSNSEFLLLFNQAATDRAELAKLLHISDTQMGYITNDEAGHGLLRIGGSLAPFSNTIPKDTELYRLMSTLPARANVLVP